MKLTHPSGLEECSGCYILISSIRFFFFFLRYQLSQLVTAQCSLLVESCFLIYLLFPFFWSAIKADALKWEKKMSLCNSVCFWFQMPDRQAAGGQQESKMVSKLHLLSLCSSTHLLPLHVSLTVAWR